MKNGFVTVGGVRLEYAWHGLAEAGAPTLIVLHEGLGCVALWRDFPEKLATATACRVLVYSRQGYGGSDPCDLPRPVSFMHHEGLTVLPHLIEALQIGDHILVGHSDGGSIALINAGGVVSENLKGVVTLAAHVFVEDVSVSSIADIKTVYETTDLRDKLARHHGNNTDCAFWGWNGVWLNPDFRDWNIEEYLPKIKVPVLAIQGVDDEYGTADQVRAIAEPTGAETRMIENCGHSPQRDQPALTLEAITEFVASKIPNGS
jgi:pimeloyl-ACP methyl ester carboxylesterase